MRFRAGVAFQQLAIPASMNGNFALSVTGQGFFHSARLRISRIPPGKSLWTALDWAWALAAAAGNLDIDTFNSTFRIDIVKLRQQAR